MVTPFNTDDMGLLDKEAAATVGFAFTGIAEALFHIAAGTGHIPSELVQSGIKELIIAILALPAVAGLATRTLVYSNKTYIKDTDDAYDAGYSDGHDDGSTAITITADPPPVVPTPLVTFPPVVPVPVIVNDSGEIIDLAPEPEVAAIIADAQNEEIDLGNGDDTTAVDTDVIALDESPDDPSVVV